MSTPQKNYTILTAKATELKNQGMDVGDVARELMRLGVPMADAAQIVRDLCAPLTARMVPRYNRRTGYDSDGYCRGYTPSDGEY